MINLLAHAGEEHDETVEAAQHVFEVSPWIATPLALLGMALVIFVVHKTIKNSTVTYVVTIFGLLLTGMLTYSALPALSIISIITGFILSLGTVLLGAGAGDK